MTQPVLFAIAFALGAALRVIYFLQNLLAKRTAIRAVTVVLDFLWCAVAFSAFFLVSLFLAGGSFHFYMLCGTLAGFFLVSVWL